MEDPSESRATLDERKEQGEIRLQMPEDGFYGASETDVSDVGQAQRNAADDGWQYDEQSTGNDSQARANGARERAVREPVRSGEPRFEKLYAAEAEKRLKLPSAKAIEKNRQTFLSNKPPGPGATFKQLNAYREKAFAAGISIRASDLEAYQTQIENYGPQNVISQYRYGFTPPGGASVLAQAVIAHNPALTDRLDFENARTSDARDDLHPPQGLSPQDVTADGKRFEASMNRLAQHKPLSKDPSFKEFRELREAMRGVGVRLQVDDLAQYKEALARKGASGLRAPGGAADLPLSAQLMVDLQRQPADRQLIGASADRWDHVLMRNPQFKSDLAKQTPAAQPPPLAVQPPAVPQQPIASQSMAAQENIAARPSQVPYRPAAERDAANPYGVRIPAPSPRPQMTRNGVAAPMLDGYRQTGPIVAIDAPNNRVFQQIAQRETVAYALSDVEAAIPREQLERAAADKRDVQVRVNNGAMAVNEVAHDRGRELGAPSLS